MYKTIDKINELIGRYFFKNGNSASYNIYKEFYKKNIVNKNILLNNKFINNYFNFGYSKIGTCNPNFINKLNILLAKQNPNNYKQNSRYIYILNNEIIDVIKNIINKELKFALKKIQDYYNNKIYLGNIDVTRNFYVEKIKESYSNFFHSDGYVYNMFTIFINLHEVKEEHGPLTIVKNSNNFFKKSKYKGRNSYIKDESFYREELYKNTGQAGDIFLFSNTEVLHKAGDVKQGFFRDMLFLNFVALPYKSDDLYLYFDRKSNRNNLLASLSKIPGLKKLYKFYLDCKNNRIN
jgi:hypothetical protein